MKLPIHLDIEGDTIWTTYKAERELAVVNFESLQRFIERWKDIYPFKIHQIRITDDMMLVIRTEKVGNQDLIATNIILPQSIFTAMKIAKEYNVPLNTAFIQSNGGLTNFEEYKVMD